MCMITYVPAGVDVPWDGINQGTRRNTDGHGWAVAKGGDLLVSKSMSAEEALDSLEEARKEMGRGSVVLFHSRYATHGTTGLSNVHPFYVGGGEDSVMAHNGVMPSAYFPKEGDTRSDTRVFADSIGAFVTHGVPSRRGAAALSKAIGSGNKLVFLSVKSGTPKVRIVNANAGVWEGGVWYSNRSFEPLRYTPYIPSKADLEWNRRMADAWEDHRSGSTPQFRQPAFPSRAVVPFERPIEDAWGWSNQKCPRCGSKNISLAGLCLDCLTCTDCGHAVEACDCFVPRSLARAPICPKCKGENVDESDFDGMTIYWCEDCTAVWDSASKNTAWNIDA